MARIEVEIEEYLDEVSTEVLERELESRRKRSGHCSPFNADYIIPKGQAEYALDQSAAEFRKLGRHDLAFKLDEIKHDYVQ